MSATRDGNGKFLKGHPGLPGAGRPKGSKSLSDVLRRRLLHRPADDVIRELALTWDLPASARDELMLIEDRMELIGELLILAAARGSTKAQKEIFDRLDPKPKQVEISGKEGGPVRLVSMGADGNDPDDAASAYFDELKEAPPEGS